MPWQSVSCVGHVQYYTKFLVITLAPLAVSVDRCVRASSCFCSCWFLSLLCSSFRGTWSIGNRISFICPHSNNNSLFRCRHRGDPAALNVARETSRRMCWKIVLFTLFLMCVCCLLLVLILLGRYPGVSSTVLRLFVCVNIEGTNFLVHVLKWFAMG